MLLLVQSIPTNCNSSISATDTATDTATAAAPAASVNVDASADGAQFDDTTRSDYFGINVVYYELWTRIRQKGVCVYVRVCIRVYVCVCTICLLSCILSSSACSPFGFAK